MVLTWLISPMSLVRLQPPPPSFSRLSWSRRHVRGRRSSGERPFQGRIARLGLEDATGLRSRAASPVFPEHICHIEPAMRRGCLQQDVAGECHDLFGARALEDALGYAPQPFADILVDLADLVIRQMPAVQEIVPERTQRM